METFEGIALSMRVFVVDLDSIVIQPPLAVSVLEGDGIIDKFEEVRDGGVVGQRHVEEHIALRQAVAPHMEPQSKISIHVHDRNNIYLIKFVVALAKFSKPYELNCRCDYHNSRALE